MTNTMESEPCVSLPAQSAGDLMTPNPVSIRDNATVADALALLAKKVIHAAPVIDETGRAVGVLSATDLLIHEHERSGYLGTGVDIDATTPPRVRDLMTPAVFALTPDATAKRVVEDMLALNVHQLFVVDRTGVLVGVITATDVLRRLAA
ncbi:MAG: CBS domain-containing protein [Gemmataceae bacterium]|nr:CBS domain-containing protein [Gemmataceae bacterium]